ncbi:MAG TPA: type II toxin-antitoxin system RelE/ParE family toxin [Negativicutes bacterium]|jgi:plasmid stabilization system protein ParE
MVKWSAPAKQDLKQIHDFIARDSERYAKKVTMDFVTRSESFLNLITQHQRIDYLLLPSDLPNSL